MTDYKTVFQLAQEKGYVFFLCSGKGLGVSDDRIYYLELTLIQKWLRDEHNLSVYCDIPIEYYWRWVVHGTGKKAAVYNDSRYKEVKEFDTYEEALLQGIHEALKLQV